MDSQLDVSVIIVNWNTCDLLRGCIESVYEQTSGVTFEVVVVDNASTDGSVDMVRDLFPKVRLITNNTNKGYAAGVNQGIGLAQGRYFLVLNSDTIICDAAIEKTVAYGNEHPEAAVVGCQVWKNLKEIQPTCFRFPSVLNLFLCTFGLSIIFKKNRFFGRERMLWWPRDRERQVDVVSGMFMLVRRKAVDEVGLIDEAFFFLSEETDWCYRFSKAGWKMMFWPGARIIHVHGGMQSRKKANLKMMVQSQKSMLIFFRKNYTLIEYLSARLLLTIHCGWRYVVWGFIWFCRRLVSKDTTHEAEKTRGFWQSFNFCALGYESRAETQTIVKFRFGTLKNITEFIFVLWHRMFLFLIHKNHSRVVIYYHSLKEKDVGQFENQMKYLAKQCRVVKASEIVTASINGAKVIVAVTFDDAFVSFRNNALPILQRHGLPAAVFVPTGNLGKQPTWSLEENCPDGDEIVMNEEQVAELDRLGYEILSHTVSHPHLTKIDDVRLEAELERSKLTLERIVGHNICGISYPYGAYNDKICKMAERVGYQVGFSIEPYSVDSSPDSFHIGRFVVSPADSMLKFKLKVRGAYQVAKYLGRLKRMFVWMQGARN